MDLSDKNDEELCELWHHAHETIDAMEKMWKESVPYVTAKQVLEEITKIGTERLETRGASSITTAHGTIHTVSRTTAKILDPEAFWDHVLMSNHPRSYLDLKANMTACRDELHQTGRPVPGVELSTFRRLSITSPKRKPEKGDDHDE